MVMYSVQQANKIFFFLKIFFYFACPRSYLKNEVKEIKFHIIIFIINII